MKIFNLIWGFSLGAGIDKCYLIYDDLASVDSTIKVHSVCINISNIPADLSELKKRNVTLINIKSKKYFSWISKLNSEIQKLKPDVIFTHGFNGAIIMLILKILKGQNTPVVCSYHGRYHAPTKSKKIVEPIYNKLTRYVYKKIAVKVITVEKASKLFLSKKGIPPEKIVVVHNGIKNEIQNASSAALDLPDIKGIKLITVSSLFAIKGLNYLIEALAIVAKKTNTSFTYIMIGEGPELNVLKQKAQSLGVAHMIYFAGYQTQIVSWLNFADIYLLPSLSEAHSIALLEAMRAGKAIVATNVGGNPESIRHEKEGLLVPPKQPDALADALLKLLESEQLKKKYGEAAKARFKQKFTEDVMKRNLINALKL